MNDVKGNMISILMRVMRGWEYEEIQIVGLLVLRAVAGNYNDPSGKKLFLYGRSGNLSSFNYGKFAVYLLTNNISNNF